MTLIAIPSEEPACAEHPVTRGCTLQGPKVGFGVRIGLKVTNPDGSLASEWESGPGDLATNLFMDFIKMLFSPAGTTKIEDTSNTDVGGASRALTVYSGTAGDVLFNESVAGAAVEIGIGSSGTAVARTDTALGTQLSRGAASAAAIGGGTMTLSKAFVNASGGTWTVREAGLFMSMTDQGGVLRTFLWFHDLTAVTTVNDGQTVTVTYTFTFP